MKGTQRFFDEYANKFDALYGTQRSIINSIVNPIFRRAMKLRYEKTISYAKPIKDKTVFDVGCGPGVYSVALAKLGAAKVVGVDFSQEMINIAQGRAEMENVSKICSFVVSDIFEFQADIQFDYSIMMGFMDYISHPIPLIEKILKMTKDKVFISFPMDGGILAAQRKMRYKKRCELYMYREDDLNKLLSQFKPHQFKIENLGRDYFATIFIG